MVGLLQTLTELFLIFADLYVLVTNSQLLDSALVDFLAQFLALLATMLEEPVFAAQIAANKELCAKAAALSLKDDSLVSSNANIFKLM